MVYLLLNIIGVLVIDEIICVAVIKEYVVIKEPWENIEVTRTLTQLKIYYDLDLG